MPRRRSGSATGSTPCRPGRIVQSGTPAELYAAPVDPFVAGFFGPVNRFHGRVAQGMVATPVGTAPADGLADGATVAGDRAP